MVTPSGSVSSRWFTRPPLTVGPSNLSETVGCDGMIAATHHDWVPIVVAATSFSGAIAAVIVAWFLKRLDSRNTEQHAENGTTLGAILTATQANNVAIGAVKTTLDQHIEQHHTERETAPR